MNPDPFSLLRKLCKTPSSRGAAFSREALAPWRDVAIHSLLISKVFRLLHFVRNNCGKTILYATMGHLIARGLSCLNASTLVGRNPWLNSWNGVTEAPPAVNLIGSGLPYTIAV